MSNKIKTLLEDDRGIEALYFADDEGSQFKTDGESITSIKVYGEPGLYSDIPWFAIFKGDEIVARVPAYQVSVHYRKKERS